VAEEGQIIDEEVLARIKLRDNPEIRGESLRSVCGVSSTSNSR